ncbi:hypothetical protein ACFW04_011791 [Cataglyphis niger]
MLQKKGNFYYNVSNDINTGELIICRRPAEKCKYTTHHTAYCIDQKRKSTKTCNVFSLQIMGRYASEADNVLRQIKKLCLKYPSPHHHDMIRQRLRQRGCFLLEIKQHCQDIDDLSSVYHPKYYRICIDVIIILVKNFLTLLNNEYGPAVNKVALETQMQLKRKKKVIFPSIDNIKKLDNFLKLQRITALNNLKLKFSFKDWFNLSENGFNAFSIECQKIVIEYVRFTIRGKLNRTISVLLDSELQTCVELILRYRKKAGISLSNPYVFGSLNKNSRKYAYLKAYDMIRKFSIECGTNQPKTLRGTTLRKHVVTLRVNLNLMDTEIMDLANFIGHENKIHREYYRMPVVHREILQMSKIITICKRNSREAPCAEFGWSGVRTVGLENTREERRTRLLFLPLLHEIQELIKKNPIALKCRTAVMIKA